jgi:hypothetical protein
MKEYELGGLNGKRSSESNIIANTAAVTVELMKPSRIACGFGM